MLSKSNISFIRSLHQKKYRKETQLFLVEGTKSIQEFLQSDYEVVEIFSTEKSISSYTSSRVTLIDELELNKISALSSPSDALAIVKMPQGQVSEAVIQQSVSLVLDGIQDPGNLGTIIRTADWFGFNHIICSNDTVEAYNPKVVQASMGALSRMHLMYVSLPEYLEKISIPIYAAMLSGKNLYQTTIEQPSMMIMGNEGNGVSPEVIKLVTHPITIPRIGRAESLNVGIATAVFCSEIQRNKLSAC